MREALGTGFVQWLDGSFVTQKLHPRDIDFVTFLPFHPDQPLDALVERFRRRRIDSRGVLDGYFVIDYPAGHPWHPFSQADYVDWLHRFGTSRKFERKGIVQLHF